MFSSRPFLLVAVVFALTGLIATPLFAQISVKAVPYSFRVAPGATIPTYVLTAASRPQPVPRVLPTAEEHFFIGALTPTSTNVDVAVDLGFDNAGQWHALPDGGRLWQLRLASPGVAEMHLVYDDFWMPAGAQLFLYSDDRNYVLGAFTEQNNKPYGSFSTDFVPGEATILEYYEPAGVSEPARLHIDTVVQRGYAGAVAAKQSSTPYTPSALSCSINVSCSEGDSWSEPTNAVVKISNGCTGVLVNNTEEDERPYVLTAYHCGAPSVGQTVNWVFQFNYQSPTCADPQDTPVPHSISGATVKAASGGAADFVLLELSEPIPQEFNVYFAGWSIEDQPSAFGAAIGHPQGDIKKITLEDNTVINFNSAYLRAEFDRGTIESGSSGAPFFNEDRELVGLISTALSLDPDACSGTGGDDNAANILVPKLSYMWGRGLQQFLDPNSSGATSLPFLQGTGAALPVELVAFDAVLDGQDLELRWETASETNNAGFEIQHYTGDEHDAVWASHETLQRETSQPQASTSWEILGWVDGHGTTLDPQAYRYLVNDVTAGTHRFRLKQVDYDGTFEYSPEVEVAVGIPTAYHLSSAYPNPFNPETHFSLSVARTQHVQVAVFDAMGRRVAMLHDGVMNAQTAHAFTFEAPALPSGLYLIRVLGERFVDSRMVTLLK